MVCQNLFFRSKLQTLAIDPRNPSTLYAGISNMVSSRAPTAAQPGSPPAGISVLPTQNDTGVVVLSTNTRRMLVERGSSYFRQGESADLSAFVATNLPNGKFRPR